MKTPERTPQRTTEEIKRGLEICFAFPTPKDGCNRCPYISERRPTGTCRTSLKNDALALIQQHEATWQQVSKALCGKENATLEEVLQVIDQVKVELAFVTLERDVLFTEIKQCNDCYFCKHYGTRIDVEPCQTCILDFQQQDFKPGFEWRGFCPENTEVQDNG